MPRKISNSYGLDALAGSLRQARLAKGWSQRDLGARANMPQAQISRIENVDVDPQVSTLIELARTLDLDLRLVPRSALTAVDATIRSAEERSDERDVLRVLLDLRRQAKDAAAFNPERPDLNALADITQELDHIAPLIKGSPIIDELRRASETLGQLLSQPAELRKSAHSGRIAELNRLLRQMRSQLVHAPQAERPAYSLDDED